MTMLQVYEICESRGITFQKFAKRSLYTAIYGNLAIGELHEIANASNLGVADLIVTQR